MKFLFITTHPLVPNNSGYTVRLYNILKRLKQKGNTITLISFVSEIELNIIENYTDQIYVLCDRFVPIKIDKKIAYLNCTKAIFSGKPFKAEYYNYKEAKSIIKTEIRNEKYDYICGYLYSTSQFLDMASDEKIWLDAIDSISMLYSRQVKICKNIFKKLFLLEEQRRVLKVEKHSVENYDLVTIISDVDKGFLSQHFDAKKVLIVKNGVTIDEAISDTYNSNQIAYLGDMAYIQNHDAAMWFIDNVLPRLKEKNPDIVFKIIGKGPKPELYEHCKNNRNVVITGIVDDVKKELTDCAVLVCPIKISSGLQNKVLEAMSIGVPAIVSKQVALPITCDESVLVQAETTDDWINKIIEITEDASLRTKFSKNSKNFIKQNFSWETTLSELEKVLGLNG